jgi:hypothetical protein
MNFSNTLPQALHNPSGTSIGQGNREVRLTLSPTSPAPLSSVCSKDMSVAGLKEPWRPLARLEHRFPNDPVSVLARVHVSCAASIEFMPQRIL